VTNTSDYTHRLERVLAVCRSLSANLELEPLLQVFTATAAEITRSESSSLLVYDKVTNSLRFIAAPAYILNSLKTINVPLDSSVAGWVYNYVKPMAINQATKDERVYRVVDLEIGEETRSLAAVPLVFKGKVIGVLEAINKLGDVDYTGEDIHLLEIIATQAAVAIQGQQLITETDRVTQKSNDLDRMKSDFIAIASHELRTPLGLILGHASYLSDGADEILKPELDIILKNAVRLNELIEQFSNLEQLESGRTRLQRSKVVVQLLVKDVLDTFQKEIKEKGITLLVELGKQETVADIDAEKISVTVRNLVQNAINFTNRGGIIQVKVEQVPGYVKLSVVDNGVGIPAEDQTKIFQRFYQVEKHLTRKHGGMGLGLSISKDLVEMHGGRIWVDSVEGKGSKFTFLIPQTSNQPTTSMNAFRV
jgi:signal transduction histidine kinase